MNKNSVHVIFAFLATFFSLQLQATQADLRHELVQYIASKESDEDDTIRVQSAIDSLVKTCSTEQEERCVLQFGPGDYRILGGLLVSYVESVSGKKIVLRGSGEAETRIVGSIRLTSLSRIAIAENKAASNWLKTSALLLPFDIDYKNPPNQFFNNLFLVRNGILSGPVRYPRSDYRRVLDVADEGTVNVRGNVGSNSGTIFVENFMLELAAEPDAFLYGFWFWDWAATYQKFNRVPTASGFALSVSGDVHHYGYRKNARYFVVNAPSSATQAGDWFFRETNNSIQIVTERDVDLRDWSLPVAIKPLLTVQDGAEIELTNLSIGETRGSAVRVEKYSSAKLQNISIYASGGVGLVANDARVLHVESSSFYDLAYGAVDAGSGDRGSLLSGGILITKNLFRDLCELSFSCPGAVVLRGVAAQFTANVVERTPGIAVWLHGNDHIVEGNSFLDIAQELDDSAAVYSGRDWTYRGFVIENNRFIRGRGVGKYGVQAVYLDDGLSGAKIRGNFIVGFDRGILVGGGRDNLIEDNSFGCVDESIRIDNRGENWMGDAVKAGGVLRRSLATVPYLSDVWKSRYPDISSLTKGTGALPEHNSLRRNRYCFSPSARVSREDLLLPSLDPDVIGCSLEILTEIRRALGGSCKGGAKLR